MNAAADAAIAEVDGESLVAEQAHKGEAGAFDGGFEIKFHGLLFSCGKRDLDRAKGDIRSVIVRLFADAQLGNESRVLGGIDEEGGFRHRA